jgi:hypothetical protein
MLLLQRSAWKLRGYAGCLVIASFHLRVQPPPMQEGCTSEGKKYNLLTEVIVNLCACAKCLCQQDGWYEDAGSRVGVHPLQAALEPDCCWDTSRSGLSRHPPPAVTSETTTLVKVHSMSLE